MTVLTKENFKAEVEDYKGLVVIDLWATWCGPCLMLAPTIDALERVIRNLKGQGYEFVTVSELISER